MLMRWREDLRSKVVDGVMASAILFILVILLALLVNPIRALFGQPGLLVYILILLAAAALCLEQSVLTRYPETTRAWYGMAGGTLAWTVIRLNNSLDNLSLTSNAAVLTLILLGVVVATLWRRILPLGVRYFSAVILLNWVGRLFLDVQTLFAQWLPFFRVSSSLSGVVALAGVIGSLIYIFFHSERRLERLGAALLAAFFMLLAVEALRGVLM